MLSEHNKNEYSSEKQGLPCSSNFPVATRSSLVAPAHRQETRVRSLGWEDPLEKGMATHSQSSCLENPMDRGDLLATAHGVTKSRTQLSN